MRIAIKIGLIVRVAGVAMALAGCATLPRQPGPVSRAVTGTPETALGRLVAPTAALHAGESGFLLYNTGEGSIQARVALTELAQASIDAQYFEWAGDLLGRTMMARIIAAADRGVRVRLLIDDYSDRGHDLGYAALDAHPNIEVRVFNPFVRGRLRVPQYLTRFTELGRRMHNKMFVVDGQVAVVGGRNLTDDYFGMGQEVDFRDFDLLAIGAVVPRAAAGFDSYWNSAFAWPISALRKPPSAEELARARARFQARVVADGAVFPYRLPRDAVEALALVQRSHGHVIWAPAEVIYDDPAAVSAPSATTPSTVARRMKELTDAACDEIVVENAYLLPDSKATAVQAMVGRGLRLRLLTNSLATTDVVAINAAYSKARPALVELGVALYEMKPYGASRELYLARSTARSRARLALHGKAAVFDRETVFLGSFNLDPRSMYLDTEVVFLVRSSILAARLLEAFAVDFDAASAWRIGHVVGKNKVAWISEHPGRVDVEPHDPAGLWRRVKRSFAAVLPIRRFL